MDYKFILGTALGMVGGALITANSVKARQLIKDGQEQVEKKMKKMTKKKSKN